MSAALLATACITKVEPAPVNAASLTNMLEGVWTTAPDDSDNNFVDTRVKITPLGPGEWIYLQLNTGPEKKLYRQRIFQFLDEEPGAVTAITYSFAEPEKFADILSDKKRLNAITLYDLEKSLNDGCEMVWRYAPIDATSRWIGRVEPATCKIFSERRQAEIAIEGETRVTTDRLRQTERGFNADGEKLFGTKPGKFIELYRSP